MRIGLVIYGSLATLSGGYLYDRQLVAYLRNAGWSVDILSLPWRNYPAHLADNMRLDWARRIASAHYDLLLQDELNHPSLFLLNSYLRRVSPTPIVSIVHHLRVSEAHPPHLIPLYRLVERSYLRTLDGVLCNSHTTRRNVAQLAQRTIPATVAYPAADHLAPPAHGAVVAALKDRLSRRKSLQLLFVGNLIPRKALHTVLDALAQLPSNDWHLHIVGNETIDRAYSASMRQHAATLALSSKLTWHGRVTDDTLTTLYQSSDLLVMPSYEGFGIVFLEAMAHGLPVLAANVGAAPEIIENGVNGYLVAPGDHHALQEKLRLLVTNRVHLATLGYHARCRFEAHPTWAASMQAASEWLHETEFRLTSAVDQHL